MVEWKPEKGLTIEKIYCWIGTDEDGGEGIIGAKVNGMWFMLAGADRERVESYRRDAAAIAQITRRPVKLKVFGTGTVIDEVTP
jgi:hypothetical protein